MHSSEEKQPWLHIILTNMVVFVAIFALCCAVGEIYYRFFYDTSDSFALTKNARRWFERHYQYNNVDARDNIDYHPFQNPGKERLVFIGDSFTAGHGIADLEKRFANRIRKMDGDRFEVLVLAQGGFETGNELFILKKFIKQGLIYGRVVLVYCLNDINDLLPESKLIHSKIRAGMDSQGWFLRHSYFFNTYYYRLRAILDPNISNYYGYVKNAYSSNSWDRQKERLKRIVALCRANHIKLSCVTFPFLNAIGGQYEYSDVHQELDSFWQEQHVPHLDLLPVYQKYSAKDLVVGSFDAHPNEFAHQLAAQAMRRFIKDN